MKNINDITDDSLATILSYLSPKDKINSEKVCSKWKRAAALSWYKQNKLSVKNWRSDSTTDIILRCGRFLKELKLDFKSSFIDSQFIATQCKNLQELNIYIVHEDAFYGLSWLSKLMKIKLIHCGNKISYISNTIFHLDKGVEEIIIFNNLEDNSIKLIIAMRFSHFTKLTSLSIQYFHLDKDLIIIIENLEQLTSLDLKFCILDKRIDVSNLTSLKLLDLRGIKICNEFEVWDDDIAYQNIKYYKFSMKNNFYVDSSNSEFSD